MFAEHRSDTKIGPNSAKLVPGTTNSGHNSATFGSRSPKLDPTWSGIGSTWPELGHFV